MKQPKNTVKQLVINDRNNPLKTHVFRIYRDRHVSYNQGINGRLFYKSFQRATRNHGYFEYLNQIRRFA